MRLLQHLMACSDVVDHIGPRGPPRPPLVRRLSTSYRFAVTTRPSALGTRLPEGEVVWLGGGGGQVGSSVGGGEQFGVAAEHAFARVPVELGQVGALSLVEGAELAVGAQHAE